MRTVQATTNTVQGSFNPKIDAWAEGTLMAIDADGAKLSIRGTKRLYATEYAKMLKSIHDKTQSMTPTERASKTREIRQSWVAALQKAELEPPEAESDFTFHLPKKGQKLRIVDETAFYHRDSVPTGSTSGLTDAELDAVQALKDLKVGEHLVVGYASGVISDSAYAVIKANGPMQH